MDQGDELNKLRAKREYLQEWAKRLKKAIEVLPFIQMLLDSTYWELKALNTRSKEANEILLPDLIPLITFTQF